MNKIVSYTEAIRQATEQAMDRDPTVVVLGLGVSYKNGADGTMGDLKTKYPDRVLDTPVSEFSNTGVCVGAAITGMRPIIHHSRVEFGMFAAEQIITQASNWNYMFGGDNPVPIVFRLAVGRQWGNGPQHTQPFYALFSSIPGLKVVSPSTPSVAKGLLTAAVRDNNPVVYMEPRWLYKLEESVPEEYYETPLDKSRYVGRGDDVTIVTYGDGVVDAIKAKKKLEELGIFCDVIDLISLNPIDYSLIDESVRQTGKLVCFDTTNGVFSVGSEVLAKTGLRYQATHSITAKHICAPNCPCPTSTALTKLYYPSWVDLANGILDMFEAAPIIATLSFDELNFAPKTLIEI